MSDTEVIVVTPEGRIIERTSFEEFSARGRVPDCDCRLIECVCTLARQHNKKCRFRVALTCAVPVSCEEHGRDVCAKCDPCTCKP